MEQEWTGNTNTAGPLEIAGRLAGIYEDFTEAVKALGGKGKKRSGKFASSVMQWVGGRHAVSDREQLCEGFLADVQGQLELLTLALEGAGPEEQADACALAAETITCPRPARSDSTTDLMKRAMIGQITPFLSYMRQEDLRRILDRMDQAYTRWQLLPVEKEVKKELERLTR